MSEDRTTPVVTVQRHGDVLAVTVNNPPVNALGVDVRRGLVEAIEAAERDAAVARSVASRRGTHVHRRRRYP